MSRAPGVEEANVTLSPRQAVFRSVATSFHLDV